MVKLNRWNPVLVKVMYFIILALGLNKISVDDRMMIFATPMTIGIAQMFIYWFNGIMFESKNKKYYILLAVWTLIMMLAFIFNVYIIYLGIIVTLLEVIFIFREKTNIKENYILKYHDAMIMGSSFFISIAFSMLRTSVSGLIYLMILIVLAFVPLSQYLSILKGIKNKNNVFSIYKFIIVAIIGTISFTPAMYSMTKYDGGFKISIEFIFYSLLLLIYPSTVIRLSRLRSKHED